MTLLFALNACWNMGASKRSNDFEDTLDSYRLTIRWGKFQQAQNFIQLRTGEPLVYDMEFYRKIKVTKYDIIDEIAFGQDIEDPREIHIVTQIEFVHDDEIKVKTMRYEQVWWYDEQAKRWFLDSHLPDFKAEMDY